MSNQATHSFSPSRERAILAMLCAVQFTHILDYMIMMPLGAGLMRVFSISPEQFSHLVAAYSVSAAVTGFAGGFVLDRFDRKHALLVLYSGFCVSTLACAFAPTYLALLLARLAAGACGGVASSLVTAMVGDLVPPQRRGRAMGAVMTAFPIASVLGVPLALALNDAYQWHAPFVFLGATSAVILVFASRVLPNLRHPVAQHSPLQQMREILYHPVHLRGFMLSAVLISAGSLIVPFLAPSMVANAGLDQSQIKWVYLAGGACTLFSTPLFGRLSDHFDKLHVLGWASLAASVVSLFVTHLPPVSLVVAMLAMAMFMIAMTGRFAPAMAMITNSVESRYRGGFMSVSSALQQAAAGISNLVAGLLVTTAPSGHLVGYGRVGWLAVGCFLLAVVLAARLRALAPHASKPAREYAATAAVIAAAAD